MTKNLVVVESPAKARTIERYLGPDYTVLASYGHVRDLPENASEVPAEIQPFTVSTETSGFIGGGHSGALYQFNNIVVGIEGDIEYNGMDDTGSAPVFDFAGNRLGRQLKTAIKAHAYEHNNDRDGGDESGARYEGWSGVPGDGPSSFTFAVWGDSEIAASVLWLCSPGASFVVGAALIARHGPAARKQAVEPALVEASFHEHFGGRHLVEQVAVESQIAAACCF